MPLQARLLSFINEQGTPAETRIVAICNLQEQDRTCEDALRVGSVLSAGGPAHHRAAAAPARRGYSDAVHPVSETVRRRIRLRARRR